MGHQARINDKRVKDQAKAYADNHRNVSEPNFKIGDLVLVKQNQTSKATAIFNTQPYRIREINGSMLTAAKSDHTINRNVEFFKRIKERDKTDAKSEPVKRPNMDDFRQVWENMKIPHHINDTPDSGNAS